MADDFDEKVLAAIKKQTKGLMYPSMKDLVTEIYGADEMSMVTTAKVAESLSHLIKQRKIVRTASNPHSRYRVA